jgi:hypothetical protein
MNIIEASSSGVPFRRKGWSSQDYNMRVIGSLFYDHVAGMARITVEDVQATDWELIEPTITITKRQLMDALNLLAVVQITEDIPDYVTAKPLNIRDKYGDTIARQLGFEK